MAIIMNLQQTTIDNILSGDQLAIIGKGSFPFSSPTKIYMYCKQADSPGSVIGEVEVVRCDRIYADLYNIVSALTTAPLEVLQLTQSDIIGYFGNVKRYDKPRSCTEFTREDGSIVKIPPAKFTRVRELEYD